MLARWEPLAPPLPNQHGFARGRSAHTQINTLQHTCAHFPKASVALCDVRKAFDSVSWEKLVMVLSAKGLDRPSIAQAVLASPPPNYRHG